MSTPEPISLRTRPYRAGEFDVATGAARQLSRTRGPGLNVLLFLLTCVTTCWVGAEHAGVDPFGGPTNFVAGIPYAVAVMGILACHEFGHYVFARLHGVDATLPFFIPAPIFFIGTLGAFIRMRTLPRDRRALFDVGAAGPWGGIIATIPVAMIGLALSEPTRITGDFVGWEFGDSLLFKILQTIVVGDLPPDMTMMLHPLAVAAWVGFLVTALNLMPVGQLDGGHVTYAWLGPFWHKWIARGTLTSLWVLALTGSLSWIVWAAVLTIIGVRHPPLANPEVPLGRARSIGALFTALLFVLTFMPTPIRFLAGEPPILRDPDAVEVKAPAHSTFEHTIPL